MYKKIAVTTVSVITTLLLSACGGGSSSSDRVVANETRTLTEGMYISYTLAAGTYNAEVTASNNGVVVDWIGGSACTKSAETKTYVSVCKLIQNGQVTVANPTRIGLGGNEVVTVKLTLLN